MLNFSVANRLSFVHERMKDAIIHRSFLRIGILRRLLASCGVLRFSGRPRIRSQMDILTAAVVVRHYSALARPLVGVSLIIIIIIQYLYSALKSCKGYRGAGGFRLRLSKQVCFEVFLKGV